MSIPESWFSKHLVRHYPFQDGCLLPQHAFVDARIVVPEQLSRASIYFKFGEISQYRVHLVVAARGFVNVQSESRDDVIGIIDLYRPKPFSAATIKPVVPGVAGVFVLGTFLPETEALRFSHDRAEDRALIDSIAVLPCLVTALKQPANQRIFYQTTRFSRMLRLIGAQGLIVERDTVYIDSIDKPTSAFVFRISREQRLLSSIVHPCDAPPTAIADQGTAVAINGVYPDASGTVTIELKSGKTFIPALVNMHYEPPKPGEPVFSHILLDQYKNPVLSSTPLISLSYARPGLIVLKDHQSFRVLCEERNRVSGYRSPQIDLDTIYGVSCEHIKGEHVVVKHASTTGFIGIYFIGACVWRDYLIIYWAVTQPGTVQFGGDGIHGIKLHASATVDGALKLNHATQSIYNVLLNSPASNTVSYAGKPVYGIYRLSSALRKYEPFSITIASMECVVAHIPAPGGGVTLVKNALYNDTGSRYAMDPDDPKPKELDL